MHAGYLDVVPAVKGCRLVNFLSCPGSSHLGSFVAYTAAVLTAAMKGEILGTPWSTTRGLKQEVQRPAVRRLVPSQSMEYQKADKCPQTNPCTQILHDRLRHSAKLISRRRTQELEAGCYLIRNSNWTAKFSLDPGAAQAWSTMVRCGRGSAPFTFCFPVVTCLAYQKSRMACWNASLAVLPRR